MRKRFMAVLAVVMACAFAACLAACGSSSQTPSQDTASTAATSSLQSESAQATPTDDSVSGQHLIGVLVYDTSDSEVLMFKDYLVKYIADVCFDDVEFMYSNSISSEDEALAFIDEVADKGGEGIMSFYNIDLAAEVGRCAEHGMYHIVASGTVSEEDFAKVADNDYFIGCVGPGLEMEYIAGTNMVLNYIANKSGDNYFILSGGAAVGNEMHYQRTFGMLDALETGYGVDLGVTKELAAVSEPTTVSNDKLSVTIFPGYLTNEESQDAAIAAFGEGEFNVVLSTLPVEPISDALQKANVKIAQVDCYSQDNQLLFESGNLSYLAGKYGSLVGPSFAAMYNAVTGHAAQFRDNGKAFRIVQNFWASSSADDFNAKYEFASNPMTPAYNYEDLQSVCSVYTPDATLEDLRALATGSSYDDAVARRAQG